MMDAQAIIKTVQQLKAERSNIEQIWDLIDRFVSPMKGRFWQRDEEGSIDWRNRERQSSEAVLAAQMLASSLHSAIVNPAYKWFSFRYRDDKLRDNLEAIEWLQIAEDAVFHAIIESNFNLAVIELLHNDISFGTSLMLHTMGGGDETFNFVSMDIKDVYFTVDVLGNLNGLYFVKSYTSAQLVSRWPDTVPPEIRKEAEDPNTSQTKHRVIRAIWEDINNVTSPRHVFVRPELRRYQECFVLEDGGVILNTEPRGFYEMPAYLLIWGKSAGSKFGYSPAMVSLADILALNQLLYMSQCAWSKNIDPPITELFNGVIGKVDMRSGGKTVIRQPEAVRPLIQGINHQVNFSVMEYFITNIRRAFYVDQLQLKDSPAMTATEVQVRYELMQRMIGPPVARIKTDFLDPMLDRSFYMLLRQGRIPQPPKTIGNAVYDIEYMGAWSRAQRMDKVAVMEGAVGAIAQLASVNPAVLDKIDIDKIAEAILVERGLPAEMIRDQDEVDEIRKQRAQQEQQRQQLEMLKEGSIAMKNIGEAGLGEMMGMAGGGKGGA